MSSQPQQQQPANNDALDQVVDLLLQDQGSNNKDSVRADLKNKLKDAIQSAIKPKWYKSSFFKGFASAGAAGVLSTVVALNVGPSQNDYDGALNNLSSQRARVTELETDNNALKSTNQGLVTQRDAILEQAQEEVQNAIKFTTEDSVVLHYHRDTGNLLMVSLPTKYLLDKTSQDAKSSMEFVGNLARAGHGTELYATTGTDRRLDNGRFISINSDQLDLLRTATGRQKLMEAMEKIENHPTHGAGGERTTYRIYATKNNDGEITGTRIFIDEKADGRNMSPLASLSPVRAVGFDFTEHGLA